jgi:mono/diheme cytochrome c family protein
VSVCCFLLFVLVALLMNRAAASPSNTDELQRGAAVFQSKGCERCHAILGEGGDRAPDLATVGQRRSPGQIKTQIINGGHGMPPFGNVLSKDEVKDVVKFLTSCRTKDAPGCRQWMAAETAQ